jgi:hypothetical protein
MPRSLCSCLALFTALSLAACGVTTPNGPGEVASVESELRTLEPATPDVTLATVRLSTTHIVTFTETPEGSLEVIETRDSAADAALPTIAALGEGASMATIYRHLRPGIAVPRELVDADTRAAQRLPEPSPAVGPEDDALGVSDGSYPTPSSSAAVMWWDWIADANWFAQYYYTEGNDGFFAANTVWAHQTKKRWTSFYKSSGFNQSFESSAWFRVARSYTCGIGTCWSTKVSKAVPPRGILTYRGTGNRYRKSWMDGSGPTARIGLAVRWTLAGTSTPPNPPGSCGNHNEFICYSGAHCKPGLVEYNGGCYGCGVVGQGCCKDWGPIPTNGGWMGFCAQGFCGYPGGYCQLY